MSRETRVVLGFIAAFCMVGWLVDGHPGFSLGAALFAAYFFATARVKTRLNRESRHMIEENNIAASIRVPRDYRGDYGTLFEPPSDEGRRIQSLMTEQEKFNFSELLRRLKPWSDAEALGHVLHPELRCCLWGLALSKIADHHRDEGQFDRALFFSEAAWNLSGYPIFAYNAGLLAHDTGDEGHAKSLLQIYLNEYHKALANQTFVVANLDVNPGLLEYYARSARAKLAELHTNPKMTPTVNPLQFADRAEFTADGRAILKGGPSSGFINLIRQMAQVYRRDLKPGELHVFEQWLGIRNGHWTHAHEDAFVRGYERFLYENPFQDESLRLDQESLQKEYPVFEGSAIDIPFPDDVRRAYSRLLGGKIC